MNSMLLTVIIPIYNAEQYLEKCISSITSQSYTNLEIILVDDGSTDCSGAICDVFAKEDTRIKVIHQANGGQNRARRAGLAVATGEYVTFADSDDWLDSDFYENVISAVGGVNYDLVICDHFIDREQVYQRVESTVDNGTYCRDEILKKILPCMRWDFENGRTGISAMLWNKFFKVELLRETMKHLDYEMTICEDSAIVYPYIMKSGQILITHLCGYHYYQREGSMMHSFTAASFEKLSRFQSYIREELRRLETEYDDITMSMRTQIEEQFNQVIARVANDMIRDVYRINNNMVKWCPPYENLPPKARIALYGAGDVGQSYYLKMYGDPNNKIVLWVDKKYEELNGVNSPAELLSADYDVILIAVESENLAARIRDDLIGMGIDEYKIIWVKPRPILFSYGGVSNE